MKLLTSIFEFFLQILHLSYLNDKYIIVLICTQDNHDITVKYIKENDVKIAGN